MLQEHYLLAILYFYLLAILAFSKHECLTSTKGYASLPHLIKYARYIFTPRNTPEGYMRTLQLITHEGYNGENHIIQTEDGYLCNTYRLQRKSGISKKYPILLVNGLPTSSVIWLKNQNKSLGFALAEEGHDVWLTNFRGNSYCIKHTSLTTNDAKFWKFSWDENGNFDLSSMIDYVLNITGKQKVIVICHSKGTTSMFALLANRTEYNDKLKLFVPMAPITDLRGSPNLLVIIGLYITPVLKFLLSIFFNIHYFPPLPSPGIDPCKLIIGLCNIPYFILEGGISEQFDYSKSTDFFASIPDFTSIQDLDHYSQVFIKGRFEAYDYKSHEENKKRYGTIKPPVYKLSKITVPTAIFWGTLDMISSPKQALKIKKMLPNVVLFKSLPFKHLDYFLAIDSYELLLKPVIELLQKYQT